MKNENVKVLIQFRIEPDLLKEIENLAIRLKTDKSKLLRNFVKAGLDDLRLADRVGLVSMVSFMRKNDIKPERVLEMVVESSRC